MRLEGYERVGWFEGEDTLKMTFAREAIPAVLVCVHVGGTKIRDPSGPVAEFSLVGARMAGRGYTIRLDAANG